MNLQATGLQVTDVLKAPQSDSLPPDSGLHCWETRCRAYTPNHSGGFGVFHFNPQLKSLQKLLVPTCVLMSVSVLLPQPGTRDPSIPRSPGVSSSTGFLVLSRFRRFYHEGFASGLAGISWVSGRRPQLCIRNRQFRGNIIPKSGCSFIFSRSSSLKLLERWVPVTAAV